jgi:hypothetical protein
MYSLPDGRLLADGTAFRLDDISYPGNWLGCATPGELSERGISTQPDEPPQAPSVTPNDLLNALAHHRWVAERAGTAWGQLTLPTDRERRSALKDAADKMRDGTLQSPIAVAFSSSVYASVTLEQLDAAVGIITNYVQKVFADAMTVAAKIAAGTVTTREQLDAEWAVARAA